MSFLATGNIVLADGRQVEFSQEMVMQREFDLLEKEVLNIAPAPIRADSLVINYGGVAQCCPVKKLRTTIRKN